MGEERFHAPIRSNTDNGQQWSGDMDAMHQLFEGTNPERVIKAGHVYRNVSNRFGSMAGVLRSQSSALAAVWKGDDAEAAIKQMRKLQQSAENIYQVSGRTAWVLKDHGEKLDWYKRHQPKEGFFKGLTWDQAGVVTGGTLLGGPVGGLMGLSKGEALGLIKHTESKAAVEHVQRLSDRAREANAAMPAEISTTPPDFGRFKQGPSMPPSGGIPGGGPPGGGTPSGGGGLPGGGGGMPGGLDGAGSGGATMPGGGQGGGIPGGGIPGGGPSGSDLAGLPGGGGGSGVDPFGKGGLGGGGGGLPGGGGGGIPGGGGVGGAIGGRPGASGMGKGSPGGGKGLGKTTGGSGRGGMGGAPMGGRGGGGQGEGEHERSTWLTEDEDVWGGNDDDTTPPVIG
ncbi:WXG100 family type VII secretion target [Actinomadura decatromicini]|uniref:WXG100 family type VII secretion target n=1 Tax=Actinomadura decatromicini TaxID=2604572 RepID=UPI0011E6B75C|nr:hypothetical protein [Actinomadura decatromicini]